LLICGRIEALFSQQTLFYTFQAEISQAHTDNLGTGVNIEGVFNVPQVAAEAGRG
jgi:hypothetical protein